jgi:hypothetical protein
MLRSMLCLLASTVRDASERSEGRRAAGGKVRVDRGGEFLTLLTMYTAHNLTVIFNNNRKIVIPLLT